MSDALFDGAPPALKTEPPKPTGKVLRWRVALHSEAVSAVTSIKSMMNGKDVRNMPVWHGQTFEKFVLLRSRRFFPKWAKNRPYQKRVWYTLIREIIGVKEPPRSKRSTNDPSVPLLEVQTQQ